MGSLWPLSNQLVWDNEADLSPAHRDQLWQYLEYAAASMVNSPV